MSNSLTDESILTEFSVLYPGSRLMKEQGRQYVYIPTLKLPGDPGTCEALLCLSEHSGYTSRLFLAQPVSAKGQNWTIHRIFDRPWHSWSWQNVAPSGKPLSVLANHLQALQ